MRTPCYNMYAPIQRQRERERLRAGKLSNTHVTTCFIVAGPDTRRVQTQYKQHSVFERESYNMLKLRPAASSDVSQRRVIPFPLKFTALFTIYKHVYNPYLRLIYNRLRLFGYIGLKSPFLSMKFHLK